MSKIVKKLSLIFSDIEIGDGSSTDDFIADQLLHDTIKKHFKESKNQPSDLILNGDTFDFMKTSYKTIFPIHVTEQISLEKLRKMHKAHPLFFETLTLWLKQNKKNRVVFIVGNHDFDIVFEKVQKKLKNFISKGKEGLKDRVIFPGFEFHDNLLLVEHGSQMDYVFKVNPRKLIFTPKNRVKNDPFLLLPWGINPLYDIYISYKKKFPLLERIVPRGRLYKHFNLEMKYLFGLKMFIYMVKSFFYTQVRYWSDPIYRLNLFSFLKNMKKMIFKNYSLEFSKKAKHKLNRSNFKVLSIGHNHHGTIGKLKNKQILNTGCWRDEYSIKKNSKFLIPKEKSYGYVLHSDKKIYKSKLIEVQSKQKPIPIGRIKEILRKTKL